METKTLIKAYLSNNISKIISLVIFSLLTIGFKMSNILCIKYIIDNATKGPVSDYGKNIILFTIILGLSTLMSLICDMIRHSKTTSFGNDITYELRSITYQTLVKGDLYEVEKYTSDEISSTIVESTRNIGNMYISGKIINLLYNSVYLVSSLILLLIFNSSYAFISILSLPIYYVIKKYMVAIKEKREVLYKDYTVSHVKLIEDDTRELKIIKTRNGIDKQIESYEKKLVENKKVLSNKINIKETINRFLPSLFISMLLLILFISTCYAIYNHKDMDWLFSELGFIIGCTILTPQIVFIFKDTVEIYNMDLNPEKEYEKIDKLLSIRAERRSENVPSLEEIHSLKFNNVSFDYSIYGVKDKVNLEKVDFEIKKGEKLGILGLPGSGKTTIADLITKIVRPRQGNVLINNCDINKLNTYYLRNIVTYVPENYQLLNTSIEQNVTFPMSLDEYKYNDALNKCKLKDLVFTLPQRDETNAIVANLSKSDIQKISLANAFYKESPIMILDDATSKLDTVTEDEIMNEFFKLKNKISIVITNRINNIVKCDKILILSNGKVVEYGTTEELMSKRNSVFAKMVTEANLDKKVV